MANLLSIAEQVWRQLFPNPGDESSIDREEVVAAAKSEYAYQMLLYYYDQKNREGYFSIPSMFLEERVMTVKENQIDVSGLKVFDNLPDDMWLQNVGGLNCDCPYVKTNVNLSQLLCGDDSMGENVRTYLPIKINGKRVIKFPDGTHKNELPIIFANMGENIDGRIEIDDAVGGIIRRSLVELFAGKIGQEDKTNNTSYQ